METVVHNLAVIFGCVTLIPALLFVSAVGCLQGKKSGKKTEVAFVDMADPDGDTLHEVKTEEQFNMEAKKK
ncbi:unnamed protein product [Bursaphelenchus okinawaensis]|uniref:Uncharacterized protein n=1 Tax=Bursaphelenchus okinawaensis TaxID=465554 RepID=A0A811K455_9BILA|nr:unnamed protein product [Bursaphelenchus okinawaensis]CAG9091955.1 unnamed protein product [Bursaphelenchus okinawaensis]